MKLNMIERGFERDEAIKQAFNRFLERHKGKATPQYQEGLIIGAMGGLLGGVALGAIIWGPI